MEKAINDNPDAFSVDEVIEHMEAMALKNHTPDEHDHEHFPDDVDMHAPEDDYDEANPQEVEQHADDDDMEFDDDIWDAMNTSNQSDERNVDDDDEIYRAMNEMEDHAVDRNHDDDTGDDEIYNAMNAVQRSEIEEYDDDLDDDCYRAMNGIDDQTMTDVDGKGDSKKSPSLAYDVLQEPSPDVERRDLLGIQMKNRVDQLLSDVQPKEKKVHRVLFFRQTCRKPKVN
jgi:hypothetical protein